VGRQIRTARRERGLTQEKLGERVGLDRKTINRAENGRITLTLDALVAIAAALHVPPAELFRDE
jgi:transcriptional regulator with XRE-family HTH domain